jgi:hypothetical protein
MGRLAFSLFYVLVVVIALVYACIPEKFMTVAKPFQKRVNADANDDWLKRD